METSTACAETSQEQNTTNANKFAPTNPDTDSGTGKSARVKDNGFTKLDNRELTWMADNNIDVYSRAMYQAIRRHKSGVWRISTAQLGRDSGQGRTRGKKSRKILIANNMISVVHTNKFGSIYDHKSHAFECWGINKDPTKMLDPYQTESELGHCIQIGTSNKNSTKMLDAQTESELGHCTQNGASSIQIGALNKESTKMLVARRPHNKTNYNKHLFINGWTNHQVNPAPAKSTSSSSTPVKNKISLIVENHETGDDTCTRDDRPDTMNQERWREAFENTPPRPEKKEDDSMPAKTQKASQKPNKKPQKRVYFGDIVCRRPCEPWIHAKHGPLKGLIEENIIGWKERRKPKWGETDAYLETFTPNQLFAIEADAPETKEPEFWDEFQKRFEQLHRKKTKRMEPIDRTLDSMLSKFGLTEGGASWQK